MKWLTDWAKQYFDDWLKEFTAWFMNSHVGKLCTALMAVGGFLWALVGPFWDLLDFRGAMDNIADTFHTAAGVAGSLPIGPVIAQLNVIFPLNEFLVFLGLSLGLWLLVIAIRFALWLMRLLISLVQLLVKLIPGL